jgi:hypothetical protein
VLKLKKPLPMFLKKALATLILSLVIFGLYAQEPSKVRIVDLEDVATVIDKTTTSSTDGSGNFPVYLYGEKQMKKFDDLYMILVRHDLPASDPSIYISVELIDMEDKSSIYEMAKYTRISGAAESGSFSIKVKDINTLQVMRKGY